MRNVRDIIQDLETRDLLELTKQIARKYHVTLEELLGRGRRIPEAAARHELWHQLYDDDIPSLSRIGEIFGRDHSTILAAVHKYEKRYGEPSRATLADTKRPALASCGGEGVACLEPAGPHIKKCPVEAAALPLTKSVAS